MTATNQILFVRCFLFDHRQDYGRYTGLFRSPAVYRKDRHAKLVDLTLLSPVGLVHFHNRHKIAPDLFKEACQDWIRTAMFTGNLTGRQNAN